MLFLLFIFYLVHFMLPENILLGSLVLFLSLNCHSMYQDTLIFSVHWKKANLETYKQKKKFYILF